MKTIKYRPYLFLWLTIPVALTISIINGIDHSLDFNMHDTYFVVSSFDLGLMISIFLAILGGLYWATRNRRLLKGLILFHVLTTILGPLLIVLIFSFYNYTMATSYDPQEMAFFTNLNMIVTALIALWILSQILFLINLIYGLTGKRAK